MTSTTNLPLDAGTWKVDAAHSSVEFTVRHMGLSKVRGRFNQFDTTMEVGQDLASSKLAAAIQLASVDTNNPDRDQHLHGTDFFGIEQNPVMNFESTTISQSGDGFVVDGALTLNGITKPVQLDVEFNGTETFPMDGKTHAGFSASTAISRKDFDVEFDVPLGVDKMMIGDKVAVELEIQLVQS